MRRVADRYGVAARRRDGSRRGAGRGKARAAPTRWCCRAPAAGPGRTSGPSTARPARARRRRARGARARSGRWRGREASEAWLARYPAGGHAAVMRKPTRAQMAATIARRPRRRARPRRRRRSGPRGSAPAGATRRSSAASSVRARCRGPRRRRGRAGPGRTGDDAIPGPPLRPRAPGRPAARALAASSCVAFHFRFAPSSAAPLWWHVYDPFAVVRWAWSWGLAPDYRAGFLSGLSLALGIGLLPAAALRLREMREPLALEERRAGSRLGTARDLRALGAFGHHGPGGSSSGSTAGDPSSRQATCTGSCSGRPGPARASTTSSRRSSPGPTRRSCSTSRASSPPSAGPMRDRLGEVLTIDATDPRSARFIPLLAVRTGPEIVTDAQALAQHAGQPGHPRGRRGHDLGTTPPRSSPPPSSATARLSPEPTLGHFHVLLHDLMSGRPIKSPHPWAADLIGRVWKTWHEKTRSSVFFNLESRLGFLASELVRAVLLRRRLPRRRPDGGRPARHRVHRHAAAHGRADEAVAPAAPRLPFSAA